MSAEVSLHDAPKEVLEERYFILEQHDLEMANDPGYNGMVRHGIYPDPREGLDPDDEWGSVNAIEDELARRER